MGDVINEVDTVIEVESSPHDTSEIQIGQLDTGANVIDIADNQHSYCQVIKVEECTSMTNENTTTTSIDGDNECNCNCHSQSSPELSESRPSTGRQANDESSDSSSYYSVTTIIEKSDQLKRTISNEQPSTSQLNSTIVNRVRCDDQSDSNGINEIEYGIDNAAFEILRQSSGSSGSLKPPTYSSLGEFYLHDEPPKYENITGNKLKNQLELPTTNSQQLQAGTLSNFSYKSKIAGAFILVGIIMITGLLVYLSISSEHTDNETNKERKN